MPELTEHTGGLGLQAVWIDIACHPYQYLVRRWNWKSGVTSVILRATIFFSTNLSAGLDAALGAVATEFGYRILFSGGVGSLTQALRRCEPPWAAALSISVVLPIISHLVEFTVHFLRGTARLKTSVGVSIAFTILSALFNLFVMRRGVLVVGTEGKTLLQDLAAMPRLIVQFVAFGPVILWRALHRKSAP